MRTASQSQRGGSIINMKVLTGIDPRLVPRKGFEMSKGTDHEMSWHQVWEKVGFSPSKEKPIFFEVFGKRPTNFWVLDALGTLIGSLFIYVNKILWCCQETFIGCIAKGKTKKSRLSRCCLSEWCVFPGYFLWFLKIDSFSLATARDLQVFTALMTLHLVQIANPCGEF